VYGQQLRREEGDHVGQVPLVIGELTVDPADGEGEPTCLSAADRVFAGLVLVTAAAGDGSEPVGRQRAVGQRSVGVAAGEQQRAQAIDRPRLGCGEFAASASKMRSASRSTTPRPPADSDRFPRPSRHNEDVHVASSGISCRKPVSPRAKQRIR